MNYFENINFYQNNVFKNNSALFGNDMSTKPIRIRLKFDKSISLFHKSYPINVIPDITYFNLTFELIDYYNNSYKMLSGK